MADGPVVMIEKELNSVLARMNRIEDEIREHEREVSALRNQMIPVEKESQRLRMALYALAGNTDKKMADANKENLHTRAQIRRTNPQ